MEGITDFHYLKAINILLSKFKRKILEDIVIIPCQGASKVDFYAKFIFDLKNIPVVLLDSDKAGEIAYKKLVNSLFLEKKENVLKIDQFTKIKNSETEDLIGRNFLVELININKLSSKTISLTQDYDDKPFTEAINRYCNKNNTKMVDNWKIHLSLKFKKFIQEHSNDEIEKIIENSKLDIYESLTMKINKLLQGIVS